MRQKDQLQIIRAVIILRIARSKTGLGSMRHAAHAILRHAIPRG